MNPPVCSGGVSGGTSVLYKYMDVRLIQLYCDTKCYMDFLYHSFTFIHRNLFFILNLVPVNGSCQVSLPPPSSHHYLSLHWNHETRKWRNIRRFFNILPVRPYVCVYFFLHLLYRYSKFFPFLWGRFREIQKRIYVYICSPYSKTVFFIRLISHHFLNEHF